MSVEQYRSQIIQRQNELARLQGQLADESRRAAEFSSRLLQVGLSINRSTPLSTIESRGREAARIQDSISRCESKKADYQRQIAEKTLHLHEATANLQREETREQQRRERNESRYRRSMAEELADQRRLIRAAIAPPRATGALQESGRAPKEYDLFISHASEDKETLVEPLVDALRERGFKVWFDKTELTIGDNLRIEIDRGICHARYGLVVMSPAFIAKGWPGYELDGLVAREIDGVKVILPIWHRLTLDEVKKYSPSLAMKRGLMSAVLSIDQMVDEIARVLDPLDVDSSEAAE